MESSSRALAQKARARGSEARLWAKIARFEGSTEGLEL